MEEELRLRKEQEERWRMEEQKMMEKDFLMAMIDEKNRRLQKAKLLKIETEKKKRSIAFYNSDHWKRAKADITPDMRSKKDGAESSYYWSKRFAESENNRTPGCRDPDMSAQLQNVKPWVEV